MHLAARILVSLAMFGALTATSIAAAGLAQDGPPEGSPETYGTAESLPGDRGVYKTAIVVVDGKEGHYADMNARFAFERLPDEVMLGPEGDLIAVQSFVSEWETGSFEFFLPGVLQIPATPATPAVPTAPTYPTCQDTSEQSCEDQWEEWEQQYEEDWETWEQDYEQRWDEWEQEYEAAFEEWEQEFEVWMEAFGSRVHTSQAADWHVSHVQGNATVASTYRQGARLFVEAEAQFGGITNTRLDAIAALSGSAAPSGTAPQPAGSAGPGPMTITEPLALSGPCGWKHSLQGHEQDMWDPVTIHGTCPPDMLLDFGKVRSLPGPLELRVSGRDTVDGNETLVFSLPEDPDLLRVWLGRDNPYPLRVLTRVPQAFPPGFAQFYGLDDEPRMYVLHEQVEFERGGAQDPPEPRDAPEPTGRRSITGPPLDGFEHPWPLRDAWQQSLDQPTECSDLREYVSQHPQAQILEGSFSYTESEDPDTGTPIVDEIWAIVASDGDAAVATSLKRHTETDFEPSEIPIVGQPQPVQRRNITCVGTGPVDASAWPVPADVPRTVPSVAQAAEILALLDGNATAYGFSTLCAVDCSDPRFSLQVGSDPQLGGKTIDWLAMAEDGAFQGRMRTESPYPDPRFSDGTWEPSRAGAAWGFRPAGAGAWHMPEPVTAGGLAAGAALAGLLYLLWPALKGALSATPLFTRIRKEDLLEHPVRNEIFEMVQSEPGLHFQEIVRRMERGRGTMEHHIRKLVAGEVLVEKAHRGFTCYFPKGQLDRRLMDAAPALKSPGAKQILHAVLEQPGTPAKDIAEKLGMAASTVNYHVKRLVEAGLVDQTRQGRTVALTGTGLGEQAQGRFGQT